MSLFEWLTALFGAIGTTTLVIQTLGSIRK